ncbi:TIGR03943 family protein [Glycomyces sp. TRM65418]|uniref:TIGR03943 family putative permease subunit n=1 Tax=Glycomyces sp. TRM65418 TaxID=2867006 RepID=UPI001CE6470D|nr:TIGR03943 family protein [Glycomyces sp. TRM65418]MCC3762357.1 TIGR03943 family protein [Glycomyces sp. TRM65418]QZD56407.1 TIGR03943 family protein [Glycomyces sp. TRM65418]
MRRDAQAVILLLVGGGMLRLAWTGEYLNYVKPYAFWLIVPAGIILVAVAAITGWNAWRDKQEAVDADGCHDGHGEPKVAWLLLAPVIGMLLVAPDALGSYEAERTGTVLGAEENRSTYPELPDDVDPVPLTLLDYAARAIFDEGETLEGHRIQLRGFILYDGDEPQLARMVVSCCAADARPVKIGFDGEIPSGLEPDQWVEVIGEYSPQQGRDEINGALVPYIEVESITEIPSPENEYQ